MKKFTILLSVLLIAIGVQAQKTWKGGEINYNHQEFVLKPSRAELLGIQDIIKTQTFEADITKAADCAVDTSLFPLLKASSLGLDGYQNAEGRFAASLQRYNLGDTSATATVHGFDFHAFFSFDTGTPAITSTLVDCNLLGVAADGSPDRTNLLATVQVSVDTAGSNRADGTISLSDTKYSATFSIPATVTGAFFLEVAIPSTTDLIGIFRNALSVNSVAGDGAGAGDGWYVLVQTTGPVTAQGTDITGTNGSGEPIAWDSDNLLHPHIEFSIAADFNLTDASCLAHGEASIFENTSSSMTGNKYFNVFAALSSINSQPDSSWRWIADTSDQASAINWGTKDLVTVYNAPTTSADVGLQVFELGYSRLCSDMVAKTFDAGPLAVSSFSYDVDTNQTVVFTNNSTGDDFMWDFGDGNTSTDVIPTHTYATGGTYTVTLVASGTGVCPATSAQEVSVATTGIIDELLDSQVNIYPNPSSGVFTLDINMDQVEEISIEVRNMIGQKVFEATPGYIQSGEIKIDIQGSQSGIYILTLRASDRQISRKLSLK